MDAASKKLSSLYQRLQARLARTGDNEPEQAIKIRLTIGIAVLLYFCLPWDKDETFAEVFFSTPSLLALSYYFFSLAIAISVILRPVPSPVRRLLGALLDLVPLSLVMFLAGHDSVFFFVAYLWVILGNGFRYGVNYLYFSLCVSLIGFTAAITWGDYWNNPNHQPFGISLLIILILVPMYSAFLINKLHSAIDSAKHANQAKSRFLANMSHELRTPLNGVIGIADLMGETELSHQQREYVNIMRNSANTLLGLIENVLDISKIEAGKINIASDSFDMHQLINSIIHMQSPMAAAKDLVVSANIAPEAPYALQGDPQHLRQVLINLIGNAIKFTDTGAVKLLVKHLESSDKQTWLRFEVIDSGRGIAPEFLETIFEDFQQAPEISRSNIGGTGLGTTISKELVELMGGQIGVNSELGKGTMFWFELPFQPMDESDLSLAENKVLILSSEQTLTQIQPILKDWSINFSWVDNSVKAFAELMSVADTEQAFTTLLLDQSCMHDIAPVQYAQMLRAEKTLHNLSLVLINTPQQLVPASELTDYFISIVNDLDNKRLLFNAIHAAQSLPVTDKNVVSLASHYATQQQTRPLRILVAEDNLVNQQVLIGILEHAHVEVELVDSGEQALDFMTERLDDIDMLILDMNMPEHSGPEVTQALRYMESGRHIPVIILTADATPEAREACLQAGADAFLTKPINSRALLQEVSNLAATTVLSESSSRAQTTVNTESSQLFDDNKFSELANLDQNKQFIRTLLESFKLDGSKHISIIQSAGHEDYLRYRESLHALKGSATEMGAQSLALLCAQGETLKPDEIGSPKLLTLCSNVKQTFHDTIAAMESRLISGSQGSHSRM